MLKIPDLIFFKSPFPKISKVSKTPDLFFSSFCSQNFEIPNLIF